MSMSAAPFFSGSLMPSLLKLTNAKMLEICTTVLLSFLFRRGTNALVVRKTPTTFTLRMLWY